MIFNHCDGGLVVLPDDGRLGKWETNLSEKTTEPENVFAALVSRDKFGFRCTLAYLAYHSGRFGGPDDDTLGQHDDVAASGAMTYVVAITCIDKGGYVEGTGADGVLEAKCGRGS